MSFDAIKEKDKIVQWIKEWFDKNGKVSPAIVGISGGKDSSVVAALCTEALGKERVIGVMLPDGDQKDIGDSEEVIRFLGIAGMCFNIKDIKKEFLCQLHIADIKETEQAKTNLPARIRMVMLYFVSQSVSGRVANTCNLSEDYVGYATKYGDAAGDFAPLKEFTTDEVIEIGKVLGLPEHLLVKAPSDGLCGKTDEDNLGFTYAVLNRYIKTGEIDDPAIKEKIDHMHEINLHKERVIDRYQRVCPSWFIFQ